MSHYYYHYIIIITIIVKEARKTSQFTIQHSFHFLAREDQSDAI